MKPIDYGIVQSLKYEYVDFDFYEYPENVEKWEPCPFCGQKPKIWTFDNGRSTACGCLLEEYNKYKCFSVRAESIMSVVKRCDGSVVNYDSDELRKNWNTFCTTGKIVFDPKNDGRW